MGSRTETRAAAVIQKSPESSAGAEDAEEYTIVDTASHKHLKKVALVNEDEPLVDRTAALELHSKKTKRAEKLRAKKQRKINIEAVTKSFLELPAELLQEILGYLRPSEIRQITLINRATRSFVQQHERSIARDILSRRYWVLSRCFPIPILMEELTEEAKAALLNPRREKTTEIHMKPYQHIRNMDTREICSCHSCLFAWNNLCIVLDLAHFQGHFNKREPIPMIARGTNPEWNIRLIETHAAVVERALRSPLCYASILEKHLSSIVGTLLRTSRSAAYVHHVPRHRHLKAALPARTVHAKRPYDITEADAESGDDEFLERQGDNSYQLPFHRDNYYNQSMSAYLPSRKWSKEELRWIYYASGNHDRDLALAIKWFTPRPSQEKLDEAAFIASFNAATTASTPAPPPVSTPAP